MNFDNVAGELAAKTVLVTGASSGIGRAIAEAFGANGSRVAVQYRSNEAAASEVVDAIRAGGAEAHAFHCDVRSTAEVERLAASVLERFDRVDVIVNSAGSIVRRMPLREAEDELIDEVFDTNARSMMTLNRLLLRSLVERPGTSIINLTSQAARTGATPGAGLYAATKAYISNYTRALAKEMAVSGVRVNAIAPGVIDTPIHDGRTSREMLDALTLQIPLGRLGTAEDCAGAALFLASETLAGYLTGQIIEVNGGYLMS